MVRFCEEREREMEERKREFEEIEKWILRYESSLSICEVFFWFL